MWKGYWIGFGCSVCWFKLRFVCGFWGWWWWCDFLIVLIEWLSLVFCVLVMGCVVIWWRFCNLILGFRFNVNLDLGYVWIYGCEIIVLFCNCGFELIWIWFLFFFYDECLCCFFFCLWLLLERFMSWMCIILMDVVGVWVFFCWYLLFGLLKV